MSDYDSIVQDMGSAAQGLATTSIDKNPDEGAEALRLSRQTGVSPYVIHQDVDGFKNEYRAKLASNLIQDNGHLDAYIRGNPMADVVSNDDYGNLSNFSQKASWLGQIHKAITPQKFVEPIAEGVKGALEGAVTGFTAPLYKQEDIDKLKDTALYSWAGWQLLGLPVRALNAAAEATFGAAEGFAGKAAENLGFNESDVMAARREARGIVESEMGRGLPEIQAKARDGAIMKAQEIYQAAKPWIEAGIEPPRGVHPEIDAAKVKMNSEFVKQLQEVLSESEKIHSTGRTYLPWGQAPARMVEKAWLSRKRAAGRASQRMAA